MKTRFCIKGNIIYPRTRADYVASDSKFLIIKILIEECSVKRLLGRTVTFKGNLPSCAPYFWWSGTLKKDPNNENTYIPYSFKGQFSCKVKHETVLQKTWLKYFIGELEDKQLKQQINKFQCNLSESSVDLKTFRVQPFFCKDIVNTCEYFRVEKEQPIRELFSASMNRGEKTFSSDRDKSIRMLSGDKLDKVLDMQRDKPWLLCFPRWSKKLFNLGKVSYANISRHLVKMNRVLEPHIMVALRFYTFTCKLRDNGHTLFHVEPVTLLYLKNCPSDRLYMSHAMQYLEYKAIYYVDSAKTMFSTIEDHKDATTVVNWISTVQNSQRKSATRRHENSIPCKPEFDLSDEQRAFVRHIKHNKFGFLQGGPGTGKSETGLVWLLSYFKNPKMCTFTGQMVNAGQERMGGRTEVMHTIHYIFHVAKNIEHARKWLSQFDLIVIDEASNVDTNLLCKLLSVIDDACKLVMIGDLGQIFPINPGCPFHDLVTAYPQHSKTLTVNKRVNPNARLLADASACIREGNSDKIEFRENTLSIIDRSEGDIEGVLSTMCTDESHIMKFHVVVLRNIDRHSINKRVETWLLKRGILSNRIKHKLHSKCTIFKGQKITFTKNITDKTGFSSVKNGELGQVASFNSSPKGGIVINLTNGKKILINTEHGVPPMCVQLGYASTSNKAQGSEWPNVLFYMYEGCMAQGIWSREYPYVGISRAKLQCVIIGQQRELDQMCARKAQRRHTVLSYMLSSLKLPLINVPDLDKIDYKGKQIMPKTEPAVPLLSDFAPKKITKKKGKK